MTANFDRFAPLSEEDWATRNMSLSEIAAYRGERQKREEEALRRERLDQEFEAEQREANSHE